MITGSTQMVSASLSQSLQDYRSQLDSGGASAAGGKVGAGIPIQPTVPEKPSAPGKLPESGSSLDADQIKESAQQRRDNARQAAVYTAQLQQPQKLFDTYTQAAGNAEESSSTTGTSVDPAGVYKGSMDYSRRMDLVGAFEKAAQQPPPEQASVDFVV